MTYLGFKHLVTGLLLGDFKLPQEPAVINSLLEYALTTVAMTADAMKLMTLTPSDPILRLGPGDYFVRKPALPESDTDELDIDNELVFAVARLVASMISKTKGGIHVNAANRIILDYNAKSWELIEQMENEQVELGYVIEPDTSCSITNTGEFVACEDEVNV